MQQITRPADVLAATFTHEGGSNFAVKSLDASLTIQDLLVNTIGNYQGTVLVDESVGYLTTALEITADGPWTVTLVHLSALPSFDAQTSGTGDAVLRYLGNAGVAAIQHTGQSNFAVKYYNDDGGDLLVNEIGAYSGSVAFRSPPALIEITAEGSWSIAVS